MLDYAWDSSLLVQPRVLSDRAACRANDDLHVRTGLILPNSMFAAIETSPAFPTGAVGIYGLAHMGGRAMAAFVKSFLPATQWMRAVWQRVS